MQSRFFLTLLLLLPLSACTVTDYKSPPGSAVEPKPGYEVPKPTDEPQPSADVEEASNSYDQLLQRSDVAANDKNYDRALALLERAQRIAPDQGEIYLRLAKVHRSRGEFALARSTAERGLLYCQGKSECGALRRFLR